MRLNTQVAPASRDRGWIWRVRSDDNYVGDTLLAVGLALTQEGALRKAEQVRAALAPIFTKSYRESE